MKRRAATLLACLALGAAIVGYLNSARWEDAYRHLGVVDPGPHAIALALVEGDAPEGLPLDQRVHAPGTLMRLRYEQVDGSGSPVATYELRALVPPLPYFGREAPDTELGDLQCRERCRAQLGVDGAVLIERSGKAGLAEEWLLRMPVGKPYELGQRDLLLQDIGETQSRAIPSARFRVTVLEACKASLRVGEETHLAIAEFAILPVPIGLRTTRWVQLEGCEALMNTAPTASELGPPPRVPAPPAPLRRSWVDRADWESVRPGRSGGLGWVILHVDEEWLAKDGRPRSFHIERACRFDVGSNRWLNLPPPEGDRAISVQAADSTTRRVAYHFPKEDGLYFAEWSEAIDGTSGPLHRVVMPSGGDSCRVTDLPSPAEGEIVACVPSGMISDTALVPDPVLNCGMGD